MSQAYDMALAVHDMQRIGDGGGQLVEVRLRR